ncbi:hypothetical protein AB1Y20_014858 [Prymnesium parvum]|uniref:Uncharacterized protein n=1 Tax=Prymnesium parvum TaxID=97485 RepID=A0AB34JWQ1_PRYPA
MAAVACTLVAAALATDPVLQMRTDDVSGGAAPLDHEQVHEALASARERKKATYHARKLQDEQRGEWRALALQLLVGCDLMCFVMVVVMECRNMRMRGRRRLRDNHGTHSGKAV